MADSRGKWREKPGTHELKIVPAVFDDMATADGAMIIQPGDDRFSAGDTLRLREWEPDQYTGREVTRVVARVDWPVPMRGHGRVHLVPIERTR